MLVALVRWMQARNKLNPVKCAALEVDNYSGSDVRLAQALASVRLCRLKRLLDYNREEGGSSTEIFITNLVFNDECATKLYTQAWDILSQFEQATTLENEVVSSASVSEDEMVYRSVNSSESSDSDDGERDRTGAGSSVIKRQRIN